MRAPRHPLGRPHRGAALLVGLVLVTACGSTSADRATVELTASPSESASRAAPSPTSEALTGPTETAEPSTAPADTDPSEDGEAVVLSNARWVAAPTGTGSVSVQYFAMAENVSGLVQEVTVEVEMLADDGTVLGSSSPFPFFETILPGERLPVRLGTQLGEEPAEVAPDLHVSELADFKQERYGFITYAGEVVDFRADEDAVGDDIIVAQVEVTNTGREASGGLIAYYLAAFDQQGILVAADAAFLHGALEPGETGTAEAEVSWNPVAGDPAHMEVHFVAEPFLGG